MSPKIDRDDVLAQLRIEDVLARFDVRGKRSGHELRTRTCPTCGPRSRDSVVINLTTGRWMDHAHGCAGDALALLAGLAGLNLSLQFREVLELAAEIAGVPLEPTAIVSEVERAHRRTEAARRAAEQLEADRADRVERRRAAIERATAAWADLQPAVDVPQIAGEHYVAARGVARVSELGLVRFDRAGDVAVALHTADAQVVNVVRRRIDPTADPKVVGMKACPTAGTFINSLADIANGRDVVLVEGVFDALTARLAWPDAVVLGAHGAGNLRKIAAAAAPRIKLARTRLLLVPHDDEAGKRSNIAAGLDAIAAGLRYGRELLVVDTEAKDLNDAWCAGWRPRS